MLDIRVKKKGRAERCALFFLPHLPVAPYAERSAP
jgi:hypothetical protein